MVLSILSTKSDRTCTDAASTKVAQPPSRSDNSFLNPILLRTFAPTRTLIEGSISLFDKRNGELMISARQSDVRSPNIVPRRGCLPTVWDRTALHRIRPSEQDGRRD